MIRRVSKKQGKRERLYSKQRVEFLEDNPDCAMMVDDRCEGRANTVQHTKGRKGYADQWARDNDIWLINDVRFFLPACWPCHKYAEEHPNEAKEKGWAVSRLAVN
jgi:hypothetical protein